MTSFQDNFQKCSSELLNIFNFELQRYEMLIHPFLSLFRMKRAAWRYARERAAIAARWTWLSAQISDLDFKIHHHNDVHRTIRAAKGPVVLDGLETINGYTPNSVNRCDTELPASRTRPFLWTAYRKRKIVQMEGLHEMSKRAARASNIRCSCDGALAPCAVCTGREDPVLAVREPIQQLSVQERIALCDPGFHPVLSFPEGTNYQNGNLNSTV